MSEDPPLIAVVDDEESVRRALGRLIGAAGFGVATYASGPDFLRALELRRPHCVVLDLCMPQFNGHEVQEALNRSRTRLPVVAITGADSPDDRRRALRQGAVAYLRKPVDDAMLLEAIRSAIRAGAA